ncbi:MAG TPA: hypothetical protein VH482_01135 [Thermomicrobiales bacterium]|jgi:hypothetical protein
MVHDETIGALSHGYPPDDATNAGAGDAIVIVSNVHLTSDDDTSDSLRDDGAFARFLALLRDWVRTFVELLHRANGGGIEARLKLWNADARHAETIAPIAARPSGAVGRSGGLRFCAARSVSVQPPYS